MTIKHLSTQRRTVFNRRLDIGRVIDKFEFEQRCLADNFLGPLRILNARELDQNIRLPFTLNDRFADAKLVDAIADGFQRLIDGVIAQRLQLFLAEGQREIRVVPPKSACLATVRLGKSLFSSAAHPLDGRGRSFHLDLGALDTLNGHAGNAALTQHSYEIFFGALDIIFDRLIDFDFEDEMAAALKVEAQVDPVRGQKAGPPRRQWIDKCGDQINQRHHRCDGKQGQAREHALVAFLTPLNLC